MDESNLLVFSAVHNSQTNGVPVCDWSKGDYSVVQTVAVVVGSVIAVASLVYLIFEMVSIKTQIKNNKAKKTKKTA